jgi:hypothetical protein
MKKVMVSILCLVVSVILGLNFGNDVYSNLFIKDESGLGISSNNERLEQELFPSTLIIKGKVITSDNPEKRNTGIKGQDYSYDVTPAKIEVQEVISGVLLEEKITLLQHGSLNEKNSNDFVVPGSDYIFILVKTTDGKYWSYNFDDGIWKIQNNVVQSRSESMVFEKYKGMNEKEFKGILKQAFKNKIRNPQVKYDS